MNPRGVRAMLCCLAWAACGSHDPSLQTVALSNKPPNAALAQRADRALANAVRPDYRRPMAGAPLDRPAIGALYLAACRAGDKRSCWVAVTFGDPQGIAAAQIIENCRAGDLLSCRAIPEDKTLDVPNHLPGWAGRSRACGIDGCTRAVLQRECDAGFPRSCDQVVELIEPWPTERPPGYQVSPELVAPLVRLARRGCAAGLIGECFLLSSRSPPLPEDTHNDRLLAEQSMCDIAVVGCDDLGRIYRSRGDLVKAQEAFERSCQFSAGGCADAAAGYLDDHLPEPVPHRGEDLARWACQHDESCRDGSVNPQTLPPPRPPLP